jgi:hypothetical protein
MGQESGTVVKAQVCKTCLVMTASQGIARAEKLKNVGQFQLGRTRGKVRVLFLFKTLGSACQLSLLQEAGRGDSYQNRAMFRII